MKTSVIEIEVCPHGMGDRLFFFPLDRTLRGHFDFAELGKHEPSAMTHVHAWPGGIPAQRLGIDTERGEGYLIEALREPEYSTILAKIEKRGLSVEPLRQTFKLVTGDEQATWLYWFRRAVDDGNARLVTGAFPDTLPGTPRKVFTSQPGSDPSEKSIEKLISIVLALLPKEQQKRVDELLSSGV